MYHSIFYAGGVFLRRCRNKGNLFGAAAIITGIMILLAMILPAGFWWFALAIALICLGIWLLKSC
jgi:hypothetical protein